MADEVAVSASEKAAFSEEVAGNGLAPLWEIYQDLIVNEPTRPNQRSFGNGGIWSHWWPSRLTWLRETTRITGC